MASIGMAIDEKSAEQFYMQISDNLDRSHRMLMPIRGYEEMPLVSLEEAVEPLVSMLSEVQTYAYIAKQNCRSLPADDLTHDESASIMLHSMVWEPHEQCLYFALNNALCCEDRNKLKPWFLYMKLILTALYKLPSSRQIVYRGIKMDLSSQYRQEEEFACWGFSTCTPSVGILENEQFLGKTGIKTILTIECENGKDISQYSYYKSQARILLLPGIFLKVSGCLRVNNNTHFVQLKEIMPSVPLLNIASSTGMGVRFVDVSNDAGLKRVPWSKHAPVWRRAIRGICFEGTCTTTTCVAYSKQVVIGIGQRKFDLVLDSDASTCQCPMCHQYVEPIKCSFNNCDWRWSGVKQLPGKAPEKCSSGDGWSYADDAYHYFDESISGQVVWRQLLFEAREHQ